MTKEALGLLALALFVVGIIYTMGFMHGVVEGRRRQFFEDRETE